VGRAGIGRPLLGKESHVGPYQTSLYTVGVDTAKEDVYTSLRNQKPGTGYTHFSDALEGGPEYFRQLTSEKLVKTTEKFITTMRWEKTSERNEALDCAVYARAAVAVRRPNFRKLARSLFRKTEALRTAGKPSPKPEDEFIAAAPDAPPEETPQAPSPAEATKTWTVRRPGQQSAKRAVADQLRNIFGS
jgi:phage terminase large subunit GpA-like protein